MNKEHADNLKKSIKRFGVTAQGRRELERYLEGQKNTRGSAIKAKCYDCCGYYDSGKVDCKVEVCPLYPFMPYRDKKSRK